MKICWDNLEGMFLSSRGSLRKGNDQYIEMSRCKWCGESYLANKYRQSDYCDIKCAQVKDLVDQVFGRLYVKEFKDMGKYGARWVCECECGETTIVATTHLKSGNTKSCGCLKYRIGEDSPIYNSNLTPEDRINRRKIPGYSAWVQEVFKIESYTCQKCGDDRGGNLIAHHIESYNNNPELRTEISNGITFCEACHKDFHHQYGYGDNTRAQLIEFLRSN